MMRIVLTSFIVLALASQVCAQTTQPLTETEKIEALIKSVAEMKDAAFIRNGKEHTCADAAKHMRDKWNYQKNKIKTAEDFIELAASKSSTSGKPYLIRFNDGREVESGTFLRDELKKLP